MHSKSCESTNLWEEKQIDMKSEQGYARDSDQVLTLNFLDIQICDKSHEFIKFLT